MSDPDSEMQGESELFEWWSGLRGSSRWSGEDAHITPLLSLFESPSGTLTNGRETFASFDNGLVGGRLISTAPSEVPAIILVFEQQN